jgi:hypothetical protein
MFLVYISHSIRIFETNYLLPLILTTSSPNLLFTLITFTHLISIYPPHIHYAEKLTTTTIIRYYQLRFM